MSNMMKKTQKKMTIKIWLLKSWFMMLSHQLPSGENIISITQSKIVRYSRDKSIAKIYNLNIKSLFKTNSPIIKRQFKPTFQKQA